MSVKLEDAHIERYEAITKIANLSPVYSFETEKISDVVEKILSKNTRRIPIVNKKTELIGIITTMDILDAFLRKINFGAKISEIMIHNVIFINMYDTINLTLQKMKLSRRGGLPVLFNKKIVGMVTERDFVKLFTEVSFNQKVEEIMTRKPFSIKNNITILDSLKSTVNTHYRRLPVVERGELLGIITAHDLLRYIKENNYSYGFLNNDVSIITRKNIFSISKNADISEAIKMMKEKDVGGILVTDKNKLEGIVTERDVMEEIY